MNAVDIATAAAADLDAIMVVEQRGFDPRDQWRSQAWLEELAGEQRRVLIARTSDQAVVGVISISVFPPTADLRRIAVDPEFRRIGIARQLIDESATLANSLGARKMLLEVAFYNDAAIAAYGRCGFEQLTVREHYYGRDRHAMIMKRYGLAKGDNPLKPPTLVEFGLSGVRR